MVKILPLSEIHLHNHSFDPSGLQHIWDSVSYNAFQKCPFYYHLTIMQGIIPQSRTIPLTFGIAFASACDRYRRLRIKYDHEQALHWTVAETYYRQLRTPSEWTLYHHGHHEESIPQYSDNKKPQRTPRTLLRSLVAYLDHYKDDNLKTKILSDGTAASELSFRVSIPNTPFFWAGHFDNIVENKDGGDLWDADEKTTTSPLDEKYFSQYSPSVQFLGYDFAGHILFNRPTKGAIINAIQVSVTGQEFKREFLKHTESQLQSFLNGFISDMKEAKRYVEEKNWPMRFTSCRGPYGDCHFRKNICSRPESLHLTNLKLYYSQRIWDPSQSR